MVIIMDKIEGRNPVIEALNGNRNISKILIQKGIKGKKIERIKEEARNQGIEIEITGKNKIDKIAESHVHQGVIAYGEPIKLVSPEDILKTARDRNEAPFLIILDQIQDPHNFGSIIRTAYSAGVHGIVFQKNRAASITPVVVKSSAGAIEHIKLSMVTNINYTIDLLKEEGLWIAGADMDGDNLHYNADLKGPIGIVIGSEGKGLRNLVKQKCDFLVKIPMKGNLGSLNASVAAAIIMYEVVRQRG